MYFTRPKKYKYLRLAYGATRHSQSGGAYGKAIATPHKKKISRFYCEWEIFRASLSLRIREHTAQYRDHTTQFP